MAPETRILYVITRANVGGAQKHLLWLIESLRHRYTIQVITGEIDFLTDQLAALGVAYVHLPNLQRNLSPLDDASTVSQLRRIIRSYQPDIVHLHSFKASMLGRIAALGLKSKVLVTAHGLSFTDDNPGSRKWIGKWVEKLLAPACDQMIVVCRRDRESLLRHRILAAEKIAVVPNGVPDVDNPVDYRRQHEKAVSLICVGRLCTQKNQIALLRLMHRLPDNTRLIFVGDGPDREAMENMIRQLGLGARVILDTDNLTPEHRLREAQLYVSVSRWEGLSLSMIEALRAGLPLVATDVGGADELVIPERNGFRLPSGNEEALVRILERLINDPQLRESMGRASRELYLSKFGVEEFVRRTDSIYRNVLSNRTTTELS